MNRFFLTTICFTLTAYTGLMGTSAWSSPAPAKAPAVEASEAAPARGIGVVAVVNDAVISSVDLKDRIEFVLGTTRIEDTAETRKKLVPQVLRVLIDEQLQIEAGDAESIDVKEDDVEQAIATIEQRSGKPPGSLEADLAQKGLSKRALYNQLKAQIIWGKLIAKKIRPRIKISDEDVARAKKKLPAGSMQEEVQIETILLPVDKPANEASVKSVAEKLVGEIKSGAAFADVARQFSTGGAAQSTDAFWVIASQLDPAITKALASLPQGGITDPVRTNNGYQIVKLLAKRQSAIGSPQVIKQAELALKQVTMNLKSTASQKEAELLLTVAKDVAKNPGTCLSNTIAGVENLADTDIQVKFIRNLLTRLPEKVGQMVEKLSVGQVTEPFATPDGIQFFMLCERIDLPDQVLAPEPVDSGSDEQIRQRLFAERMELEAQKMMRNIRRDAFVEVRLR